MQALLTQATGSLDGLTEMIPETLASVQRPSATTDDGPTDLGQRVQQTFDDLPDDSGAEDAVAGRDDIVQQDGSSRGRRSHGGASPR